MSPQVGAALQILEHDLQISRESLWIQTKFTPLGGQDPKNVPYDENAELKDQVDQSVQKSLGHLGKIDSLLLHSPLRRFQDTMVVWGRFEAAVDRGDVKQIGISNCYDVKVFKDLYDKARIKPKVLQNRFYADSNYDKDLRAFCRNNHVTYQTFWTLTANKHLLVASKKNAITDAATRLKATPEQILFAYLIRAGHQPLTGTKSPRHMQQDLQAPKLAADLDPTEVAAIDKLFE